MWSYQVQSLKLLRLMVYGEMHLQEDTFEINVTRNVAQYPLHRVPIQELDLKLLTTSKSFGGDAFTRKYII